MSFSGIKLEVKGILEKNISNKYILKLVNPDNIVLQKQYLVQKSFKKNKTVNKIAKLSINSSELAKKYIQLFDSYGEIYLKNIFYR